MAHVLNKHDSPTVFFVCFPSLITGSLSLSCKAVGLENKEPYERDGHLNEKLRHNAALALFLLANQV